MMTATIFFILLCSCLIKCNNSLAHGNAPSASLVAVANATSTVPPIAVFNTSIVERRKTNDNNYNTVAPAIVPSPTVTPVVGLVATPTTTTNTMMEATENDSNSNSNNNKIAVSPVVEGKRKRSSNNNKLEVTLKHVRSDGTATSVPLGSLDEIPQVRRVLTRAPKGRIMLRHPSDPTTTWSVSGDDLNDWLWENGLQWKHDFDFVDNEEHDENNNYNSNDSNGNSSAQQQQEAEPTFVSNDAPLSLKDAIRASITDAVSQLVAAIRAFLWWTAALAFLALCVWIVVMALTLDMEANYLRQQNQCLREQEMLRVAMLHATALSQNRQRPFFLCPQQWEERCLDEAMKTLYNVSYFNTRHYQSRSSSSSSRSVPVHCYGYPQPQASQIYRHCY